MTRTSSKPENRGTRLGFTLFRARWWRELSPLGRSLYLGLYASAEARRFPVGLWDGDQGQMARAAALHVDQVGPALAELVDQGVAEYEQLDDGSIVLRLVKIADRCEGAFSPSVVQSWWTKFGTVPQCGVRDRHVATLRWLCETDDGDRVPESVEAAWATRFGAIGLVGRVAAGSQAGEGVGEGPPEGPPGRRVEHLAEAGEGVGEGPPEGGGEGMEEEEEEEEDLLLSVPEIERVGADLDRARAGGACGGPTPVLGATELWAAVAGQLSTRVLAQQLELWVTPIAAVALDGSTLRLRAPNAYVRSWFEAHYLADVTAELRKLAGFDVVVALEVEQRRPARVEQLAPRALERYGPRAASSGRGGR